MSAGRKQHHWIMVIQSKPHEITSRLPVIRQEPRAQFPEPDSSDSGLHLWFSKSPQGRSKIPAMEKSIQSLSIRTRFSSAITGASPRNGCRCTVQIARGKFRSGTRSARRRDRNRLRARMRSGTRLRPRF